MEEVAALTVQDLAVLELERAWWRRPGAKEQAILEHLGMSATRYYQALNRLIDTVAALEHDPVMVNRLRRLRERKAG